MRHHAGLLLVAVPAAAGAVAYTSHGRARAADSTASGAIARTQPRACLARLHDPVVRPWDEAAFAAGETPASRKNDPRLNRRRLEHLLPSPEEADAIVRRLGDRDPAEHVRSVGRQPRDGAVSTS